jgi:hypothetical protein
MDERKRNAYKRILNYIKTLIDEIRINKSKIERTRHLLLKKLGDAEFKIEENVIPPLTIIFNEKIMKEREKKFCMKYFYNTKSRNIDYSEIK